MTVREKLTFSAFAKPDQIKTLPPSIISALEARRARFERAAEILRQDHQIRSRLVLPTAILATLADRAAVTARAILSFCTVQASKTGVFERLSHLEAAAARFQERQNRAERIMENLVRALQIPEYVFPTAPESVTISPAAVHESPELLLHRETQALLPFMTVRERELHTSLLSEPSALEAFNALLPSINARRAKVAELAQVLAGTTMPPLTRAALDSFSKPSEGSEGSVHDRIALLEFAVKPREVQVVIRLSDVLADLSHLAGVPQSSVSQVSRAQPAVVPNKPTPVVAQAPAKAARVLAGENSILKQIRDLTKQSTKVRHRFCKQIGIDPTGDVYQIATIVRSRLRDYAETGANMVPVYLQEACAAINNPPKSFFRRMFESTVEFVRANLKFGMHSHVPEMS